MLKTIKEIKSWLDKYKITNYTINDDLSVDTNGSVNLSFGNLAGIPIKFNEVNGDFYCHDNQLTSLNGSPKEVKGDFWCFNNHLTSLSGSPKEVHGYFLCYNNQLTSLKGCPREVNGWFDCSYNELTSLEHLPEIHGELLCDEYLEDTREYKIWLIHHKLKDMV